MIKELQQVKIKILVDKKKLLMSETQEKLRELDDKIKELKAEPITEKKLHRYDDFE